MTTDQLDVDEVEGYDESAQDDLGDYPLDAVFVRTDQRTVGEVVRRIRAGRYDLNPDFQRDFVWTPEKQSRLIESCLMRIPLPVFYVAEATDGRIIVVDGLQRLSTFRRFFDDELKLTFSRSNDPDVKRNPLSGKLYKDLQLNLQERLEDTQLTLYILDSKAPDRAKLDIFERVNGGEPLTRQQMRNCLYNGPATIWLREAARSEVFLEATGNSLDSRKMRDREAINRFCAFSLLGWKRYKGDMDSFLADALDEMNKLSPAELGRLNRSFMQSMKNNDALFGVHAFRKSLSGPNSGSRSVLNIAFFDVCSVLLSTYSDADIQTNKSDLRKAVKHLLGKDDFVRSITYSTNSRIPVEQRFSKMDQAIRLTSI
jgi:hypothetical protein